MYCNSCGKQIADDAVSCRYCGKPTPQGDALAKLVAAARTNDQDAISALYEKTYSKVYYTVKSMIKDEDAVFDIVQNAYIKAFTHLDSFQGDMKFLPWVRQIAANSTLDWLRKKRPMLFTELNSGDGQDTPIEELFSDERIEHLPDQVIDQEETKRLLREIIEELPEDQRAAIGMYYYEEMSVKEIATSMGVSESAVKSRLMYGRNKIEKKVRELEKQGTKLYGLSPIPFLLLLFRNQEAYAAETPDRRLLHAILSARPMDAAAAVGTAQSAGTVGAAAGTEAGGSAIAGGLGALKIGLIALAAVAVVGLGAFGAFSAFGASQVASLSARPQKLPAIEDTEEAAEDVTTEEMSEIIAEDETEAIMEDETEALAENTENTSTQNTSADSKTGSTKSQNTSADSGSTQNTSADSENTSTGSQNASEPAQPVQTSPASEAPGPVQTTPAHEHTWKEHVAVKTYWRPNIITVEDHEYHCTCGFVTTDPETIYYHDISHEDENGVSYYSYDFVVTGTHEEDHGQYWTDPYVDYLYCDCGATKPKD